MKIQDPRSKDHRSLELHNSLGLGSDLLDLGSWIFTCARSMHLASLILGGRQLLPVAAMMLLVGVLLLLWSYRSAPKGFVSWVCLFLKLFGFAALTACLLEPLWSGQHARQGA